MIKVEITDSYTDDIIQVITLSEFEKMLNDYYDSESIIDNREKYTFRFIVE